MADKYDGIERYIYKDTYNLFLKYRDIKSGDDEAVRAMINDARILNFKYRSYPLASSIIDLIMKQIEFKMGDSVQNGRTYEQWEQLLGDYKGAQGFTTNSYNYKL